MVLVTIGLAHRGRGLIDAIVSRREMKQQLISYLDFLTHHKQENIRKQAS